MKYLKISDYCKAGDWHLKCTVPTFGTQKKQNNNNKQTKNKTKTHTYTCTHLTNYI